MAAAAPPLSIDVEGIFAASRHGPNQLKKMVRPKRSELMNTFYLPRATRDWAKALANVKTSYLNRRYRTCSTRCDELLDSAEASRTAETIHLVYLHFYAASALEMQVRSLHHISPYRMSLLGQARDHYRRTCILAGAENEIVGQLLSPCGDSFASSHSPAPSLSSDSTRMSSPTPTTHSSVDGNDHRRSGRKQVTFLDTPITQPLIRPDSPTLGFDDCFGPSTPTDPTAQAELVNANEGTDDIDPFQRIRTLRRYACALGALQQQINTVHLPNIDNVPAPPPPSNDKMRSLELKARVERLKADGWPRRRFNATRYEALREAALTDLME